MNTLLGRSARSGWCCLLLRSSHLSIISLDKRNLGFVALLSMSISETGDITWGNLIGRGNSKSRIIKYLPELGKA